MSTIDVNAAFFSFANHLATQLSGSGINIEIEKHEVATPPYLVLQNGPPKILNKWSLSILCQGWLVVEYDGTKPLEMAMGEKLSRVLAATNDVGHLPKYDYSVTPEVQTGTYIPSVFEISADLSPDARQSRRVITWELWTNLK